MIDFADARRKMIDSQLRPVDVNHFDLLSAMLSVPRERFVPADKASIAYADRDVPVLEQAGRAVRSLLKPAALGRLVQAGQPTARDHALVVGCATGYSAAVLAQLVADVVGLEEDAGLARQAREALAAIGTPAGKVEVVAGPLAAGWRAGAPYDLIVVDGAISVEPTELLKQLKEGGRLVAILGSGGAGNGMVYRLDRGEVSAISVFNAAAPPLPGFEKPAAFVF